MWVLFQMSQSKAIKIDDEDPPSIFKTNFSNIFHLPHVIM